MRALDHIHIIAMRQHGIVAAAQASAAGISAMALVMMCKRGRLKRVSHGVYYDPLIPRTHLTPLVAAAWWPRGGGVISHQTARDLRERPGAKHAVIHVTVPKSFRTTRRVPKSIVLHKASVPKREVAVFQGVRVTTGARTARDVERPVPSATLTSHAEVDAVSPAAIDTTQLSAEGRRENPSVSESQTASPPA